MKKALQSRHPVIYLGRIALLYLEQSPLLRITSEVKGPPSDYATSRRDLHGDGVGLLEALRKSFKAILISADLIVLGGKFRTYSRAKGQAIESYVTEFEQMHQEILDNGRFSTPEMLKQYFIFGLGPDFSEIIRHVNTDTLPLECQPLDLHSLIPVAKHYLQFVLITRERNRFLYPSLSQKSSSSKPSNNSETFKDRTKGIYKAIYTRTFKVSDFEHEVGAGCCVFHGTRDHQNGECLAIKKAIAK